VTAEEFVGRFSEIPPDIHGEATLTRFAEVFGDHLSTAVKPSACSTDWTAENRAYMKLVSPIGVYGLGLSSRERILSQLDEMITAYESSAEAFVQEMLAVSG